MRLSPVFVVGLAAFSLSYANAAPSYQVADKIALPDVGWDLVSFDPVMNRVYVAHGDALAAIDTADRKVTGKLAPAVRARAAVPINSGTEVLVTNGGDNTAGVFDAMTGTPIATIKTGEKPDAAMVEPVTGLAVVMNAKQGSVVHLVVEP